MRVIQIENQDIDIAVTKIIIIKMMTIMIMMIWLNRDHFIKCDDNYKDLCDVIGDQQNAFGVKTDRLWEQIGFDEKLFQIELLIF